MAPTRRPASRPKMSATRRVAKRKPVQRTTTRKAATSTPRGQFNAKNRGGTRRPSYPGGVGPRSTRRPASGRTGSGPPSMGVPQWDLFREIGNAIKKATGGK